LSASVSRWAAGQSATCKKTVIQHSGLDLPFMQRGLQHSMAVEIKRSRAVPSQPSKKKTEVVLKSNSTAE
jgi:hypothetical protein